MSRDSRPSLLYASPLPPQASGVATYSALLVTALSRRFALSLLVDGDAAIDPDLERAYPVLRYGQGTVPFHAYDMVLYNFGNNPYFHGGIYDAFLTRPGPIILHDHVLYYLTAGYYSSRPDLLASLYRIGGAEALAALRPLLKAGTDLMTYPHPERLPLNAEILETAPLTFVHSEFTRSRILAEHPASRVEVIPMAFPAPPAPPLPGAADLERRFGLPSGAFVLASFGLVAPTKQNHEICELIDAWPRRGGRDLIYLMVGEGGYVDARLGERIRRTGWVERADYDALLARCDAVAALRSPSMGETSLSLLEAMAAGKPCLVTDLGWFGEVPDDAVAKVPAAGPGPALRAILERWLAEPAAAVALGRRARRWVAASHGAERSAERLARALASAQAPGADGFQPSAT